VGLALARIRDGRLFKVDFPSFEAYCHVEWQYDKAYVSRLISAAQIFTYRLTNWQFRKPDHESQLRPLIGLTPEQAKQAWERVTQKAGDRRITVGMVKTALRELNLGSQAAPAAQKAGPTKAERRKLVDDTIGQLLVLVSQKADYGLLNEKVEALFPRRWTRWWLPFAAKRPA
jgi:hypothetical protein